MSKYVDLIKNKLKKINYNKITVFIILLSIIPLSVIIISPKASSVEFHKNSIKMLDDKKVTVTELTAVTAATSTAIAAIPGDATTPLANQIIKLSSYLLIIVGALYLEKTLLTLSGYLAFSYLIPVACLLGMLYLILKKDILKVLALKIALFSILIFIAVPISVNLSLFIEDTNREVIENSIESAKNINAEIEEKTTEESDDNMSWWQKVTSTVENTVQSIGNKVDELIEKAENALSKLIDAIAILLITSCVIPLAVVFFFIWIINIIFNTKIPMSIPKVKNKIDNVIDNKIIKK